VIILTWFGFNARGFSDILILKQLSYDNITRLRPPLVPIAAPGLRPIVTRRESIESMGADVFAKKKLWQIGWIYMDNRIHDIRVICAIRVLSEPLMNSDVYEI